MFVKRFAALALAVVLIFTLVGCGKKKREIVKLTLSTEDSEAILAAAGIMLPDVETAAGANSVVNFYSWEDGFHNYSDDEIVNTGFWTFSEKYGCDVEWIECTWDQRFDGLANLILSSNAPDFYPAYNETFPNKALSRMFQPVDTYVDYAEPIWQGVGEYVSKYFSINGRPYIICTDQSTGPICAYNRRVMDEWGFDDPAELFYNDEWTWDVFYNMCVDFSDKDEDRYALDGFSFSSSLMHSTGASVVEYDPELEMFVSNLDDPRLERSATLLYDLAKNECVYPWWANGWSLRNGTEGGGMKEGQLLFYIRYDYAFTGPVAEIEAVWGDMAAGEVMFCPLPRDPNGDGNYYLESTPKGYCLVKGASNPEGVALLAMCDRFKVLDPTVISIDRRQKEEIYLWNEDMLTMWDTCYELASAYDHTIVYYEGGLGKGLTDTVTSCVGFGQWQNPESWAQIKEANLEKINFYLDELNAQIDSFDPDAE